MDGHPKWDLIAAAGGVALGLYAVVRAQVGFGFSFGAAGGVQPETLPTAYGSILLVLSLLLGLSAVQKMRRGGSASEGPPPFSRDLPWVRIVGTLVALCLYVLCLPYLWFMPLTAVFLFGLFWLYGHRSLRASGVVAFVGALCLDVLFLRILSLPL